MKKELALTLSLLWLLVLLPFWRLATGQGLIITNDYAVSDIANLQHPLRHFAGQELRQGRLPLWTPDLYMGFPLLAEGQAGVFYPFNLLLFGLLPVPLALNINVLLTFIVAATGAYLLARVLGAATSGALVAGLSYALSGFFVVHVKHVPMVAAACWIPFVLWLVERGLRRSRGMLLGAGLVMGIQWLTGAPQMAYYTAGVTPLYVAGRAWQLRGERSLRWSLLLFALALVLSLGLGAVQLLPTYELVSFSERAGGVSYEFAASFPYAPENLKTFLYPPSNGDPGTGDYGVSSIFWEDYAYLGLLPLFLGLMGGLVLARRSGPARLLVGLTAVTFLLALGSNTPLYRLAYRMVPGLGFFRFPQRLFAFSALFLIVLAALTLTHLQAWLEDRVIGARRTAVGRQRSAVGKIVGALVLLAVVVDLYIYHAPWNAIVDADTWLEPPVTARVVQERAGPVLYRVFSHDVYNTFRAAYRQARGWRGDLGPYIAQRDFLQPNLNLIYDVPTADGYVNLVPDCLTALWGTEKQNGLMDASLVKVDDHLEARPGFVKLFSLYNVRFLITSQPVQDTALELVGSYGSGAHLYENRQAMPRAFAVPDHTVVGDVPAALDLLRSSSFDPTMTVVLLESPDVPPLSPLRPREGSTMLGQVAGMLSGLPRFTGKTVSAGNQGERFEAAVNVATYEPTHVAINADLSRPGWLVLSDTYYPGWEATVDGHPAPIYQANGCVRAVPLETGQHQVVFRFRPRSFYRGTLISVVSGILWVAVWLALNARRSGDVVEQR